jgi:LuxR family transcriptional regulator, quorum-sensing system regulator BjaR1
LHPLLRTAGGVRVRMGFEGIVTEAIESLEFGREAFDFVEALDRLQTPEDVVDRLAAAVTPFGIEKFILSGLPEEQLETAVLGHHWPEDYFELYTRENYVRFSPVVRRCRASAVPFAWHLDEFANEADPRALQVMHVGASYGIRSGFVVPVHTIKGYDAGVSMAGEQVAVPRRAVPGLHLMALYAFERLRALRGTPPFTSACRKRALTPREREVLGWIAQGKTAWEVGEILDIAKRTVDEHVQTAGRKLGARNRTHAIALALRAGTITL